MTVPAAAWCAGRRVGAGPPLILVDVVGSGAMP
jgi:hypothetical protein